MMMAPHRLGGEGHKDNSYSAIVASGGQALQHEADKKQQAKENKRDKKTMTMLSCKIAEMKTATP
jgi:hypothetical protein